jgi:hypothetical protein
MALRLIVILALPNLIYLHLGCPFLPQLTETHCLVFSQWQAQMLPIAMMDLFVLLDLLHNIFLNIFK